ncbi:MAG: carboxypeptidase regulatory-like domain-containing protein [Gemmatimonadales bacterium]
MKPRLLNFVWGAAAVLLVAPLAGWSQTGAISGTVRVVGVVPPPRSLEVNKNQDVCGETILADDVIVANGNVAYAVAFIEGLEGETEPGEHTLTNSNCRFDPPVQAVMTGSRLVVGNDDDVLHNTHLNLQLGRRSRTVGNWALSRQGAMVRADRALRRPGIIEVECDAHGWMHASIRVFDHPYFGVTAESGAFQIREVPVGTHTIKVWHEVFGELEQMVTVESGRTASVSFTYALGN